MQISWVKSKEDKNSFHILKNMGMDVFELEDLEKTDETLNKLVNNNYSTIIMSEEVAANSSDIIKKYKYNENINIIIAPRKK